MVGKYCRGCYCILPKAGREHPRSIKDGHTDGHPMSLGMVGLIDDVGPGGGAFTVWPRSHRRLFHTFEQQYSGGSITHNDSREVTEKAEYFSQVATSSNPI